VSIYDVAISTIQGTQTTLAEHKGQVLLIVNVASRCGLTPQYEGLQRLHETYADRGLSVLGFPCNQFLEQEPGDAAEICEFVSGNYGVTFPLYEKIDVNGPARHPIYEIVTETPDADGAAGDVAWNFEKFVVSPEGDVVARFRPTVTPDDPELVATIERLLPA